MKQVRNWNKICIKKKETVLFKTKSNKAPGPDGYSYEFFKVFWDEIKFLMLNTFKRYSETENLTDQQKTGIITCLPKQGKDRRLIKKMETDYFIKLDL